MNLTNILLNKKLFYVLPKVSINHQVVIHQGIQAC